MRADILTLTTVFSLASSVLIAPALAQQTTRLVAVAGKPLKIAHFMSVDPACGTIARPVVRIIDAPNVGRIEIKSGSDFPSFPPTNQRSKCNSKRNPSTQVWYTSRTSGATDTLQVQGIHDDGHVMNRRFTIETR